MAPTQLLHLIVKSVTPFVPKIAPLLPANEQGVKCHWLIYETRTLVK